LQSAAALRQAQGEVAIELALEGHHAPASALDAKEFWQQQDRDHN